jgi:hypothetical protein
LIIGIHSAGTLPFFLHGINGREKVRDFRASHGRLCAARPSAGIPPWVPREKLLNDDVERPGLEYGCLVASLTPIAHFGVFWGTVIALSPRELPMTRSGWAGAIGGGVGVLLLYVLTLLLTLPVIALLSIKDRDARGFFKRNWPLVLAVTYPVWGGWVVLGPFDELIVAGLGTCSNCGSWLQGGVSHANSAPHCQHRTRQD